MLSRRELLKRTAVAGAGLATTSPIPTTWDRAADVVIVGAGAAGLPAAIEAAQNGASVILVEANDDVGGHAIVSGGNVPLGGGTSAQKKHGIADSPDTLFADLTDWSVVEPNGFPDYRYNDREIVRAFADFSAATFDWLVSHGVRFIDKAPDAQGGISIGNSAPREMHAAAMAWPLVNTGEAVPTAAQETTSSGIGLIRPLEVAARKSGVEILLEHRMTGIFREHPASGNVLGIAVDRKGTELTIQARKGVIIATGGSTGNVNFRRIFDPRLTEEYCGVAGEPYSPQDASGELAAMAIGASLWGTYNQTGEFGTHVTKPGRIGCQYGYVNLTWYPGSKYFSRARAVGLTVKDYQNIILVNQLGRRFYDETQPQFTANNYKSIDPYVQGSFLNAANITYSPVNFINAALAGVGNGANGGGPIWAVFDADAVAREKWNPSPPDVDTDAGYFFYADTIEELARRIVNRHQRRAMTGDTLKETVARYNSFVEAGKDSDFNKPAPKHKIQTAPFYAAWATPVIHDSRAGLRVDAKCRVMDLYGQIIPGLYCGGESAGGFSMHGLARAIVQGRIAARQAVSGKV